MLKSERRFFRSGSIRFVATVILGMLILGAVSYEAAAQTTRRKRATGSRVTPSPTPPFSEPVVVSRADDFAREISGEPKAEAEDEGTLPAPMTSGGTNSDDQIQLLNDRIKELESDQKQKRLLLNLDILTRAEQRSESLRKQGFDLIEKENAIRSKLDQIANDIRPEMIERTVSMTGSLRPEELRDARRRSLESEQRSLTSLLTEIQATRAKLDVSAQRAEALVDKLRLKLEKEIDDALIDPEDERP